LIAFPGGGQKKIKNAIKRFEERKAEKNIKREN